MRRRWWKRIVFAAVASFVAMNLVAYRHAYRMTHFSEALTGTRAPNRLSAWERVKVLVTGVTMPRPVCDPMPAGYKAVRVAGRLEIWDSEGEGNLMLMFPGHAQAKSSLIGHAEFFRELGLHSVLVDFRGCGGSAGNVTTVGWDEAEDVAAVVAWARETYPQRRVLVYGVSMGAAAILRAVAARNVRVDGMIVECVFDRFLTTVGHRFQAMKLPAFPFAQCLVFWGGRQLGFNAFAHNPVEYAGQVTVPALVVGGELDPWVKPAETRAVAAAMRGPTTVLVLDGGSHGAFLWVSGEEYRVTVRDWVAKFQVEMPVGLR